MKKKIDRGRGRNHEEGRFHCIPQLQACWVDRKKKGEKKRGKKKGKKKGTRANRKGEREITMMDTLTACLG